MNPLYNLAIRLYKNGVKLASLKMEKARLMIEGQQHTFDIIAEKLDKGDKPIWIHASSLGEFEQGRPLIEMIKRNFPNEKILLTFFSPSGYEVRKNYNGADAVCYLPFDTPENARRFVSTVQPRMAIFVKYEFWGNYLSQLKSAGVPTYIISAIFRPGQIFFKSWGGMFRKMLGCFDTLFIQDDESKRLLEGIGVNNTVVAGDTRFDRVTDIMASTSDFPAVKEFAEKQFTLIMGSSWEPDEEIVYEHFNRHPEMKLIVAPHVISEEHIKSILSRSERKAVRYSTLKPGDKIDGDILIIDCFGILSSCYRYANAAYIGGGFGVGIHNINEAAVYGIPVVFGPNYSKFKEARDLIAQGGAFSISDKGSYASLADRFLTDRSYLAEAGATAARYIKSNLGATTKIYHHLF